MLVNENSSKMKIEDVILEIFPRLRPFASGIWCRVKELNLRLQHTMLTLSR
jgi:hypothetical protein